MVTESDNVITLSKQIRSLLALCQNSSLLSMLQWIVGHPLLRQHQLSLAFFELTPEMTWRFVQGVGPVPLAGFSGIEDATICELRMADKEMPWGYFSWNKDQVDEVGSVPTKELVGLCLGEYDYSDGLLVFATRDDFIFQSFAPIYSFIRVASEFVYRHHYMHASAERKAHSNVDSPVVEPPDATHRDSTLDEVVLTDRQSQILGYISSGLTNEEIATQMHLSLGTIRVETSRLYDRLGARNRQQAASLAHLVLDH